MKIVWKFRETTNNTNNEFDFTQKRKKNEEKFRETNLQHEKDNLTKKKFSKWQKKNKRENIEALYERLKI